MERRLPRTWRCLLDLFKDFLVPEINWSVENSRQLVEDTETSAGCRPVWEAGGGGVTQVFSERRVWEVLGRTPLRGRDQ